MARIASALQPLVGMPEDTKLVDIKNAANAEGKKLQTILDELEATAAQGGTKELFDGTVLEGFMHVRTGVYTHWKDIRRNTSVTSSAVWEEPSDVSIYPWEWSGWEFPLNRNRVIALRIYDDGVTDPTSFDYNDKNHIISSPHGEIQIDADEYFSIGEATFFKDDNICIYPERKMAWLRFDDKTIYLVLFKGYEPNYGEFSGVYNFTGVIREIFFKGGYKRLAGTEIYCSTDLDPAYILKNAITEREKFFERTIFEGFLKYNPDNYFNHESNWQQIAYKDNGEWTEELYLDDRSIFGQYDNFSSLANGGAFALGLRLAFYDYRSLYYNAQFEYDSRRVDSDKLIYAMTNDCYWQGQFGCSFEWETISKGDLLFDKTKRFAIQFLGNEILLLFLPHFVPTYTTEEETLSSEVLSLLIDYLPAECSGLAIKPVMFDITNDIAPLLGGEAPDSADNITWQNNSAGAIAAGVANVQGAIDALVAKVFYVNPAVSNFSHTLANDSAQPLRTSGSTYYFYEKTSTDNNNTDTANNAQIKISSLSWSLNKTMSTVKLKINSESDISLSASATSYSSAITTNSSRTGDITLKVTATDSEHNTASASLYFKKALRKVYYGFHADTSTYDETFIKSLASSLKLSSELKAQYTLPTNSSAQGAYIAVPANWAQPTACTVDGAVGDEDVTLVASNIAVSGGNGDPVSNLGTYNVYRVIPQLKYSSSNFQNLVFTLK